ncbi:alpha/beta fold hydrolase [Ferrovibrio sp.]|uniref:alpha/beta fold hydrolase n=1 Tax=Ferrovibrio sp. TaxID=1917215 RepID=UPI002623AEFB|nr:alpha/beta fold hydrolase [Ferrovibrio sp.]
MTATDVLASRRIRAGDQIISYLEAGNGPPLVLLHGIGSAGRSFRHQLSGLSTRHRVIAWDAPGYGESSPLPQVHPSASDYAGALAVFLDALGIERCHLVGHSLGCLMAARFAVLHPARVLRLALSSIAAGHAALAAKERERLLAQRLEDVAVLGARGMAEKRGPRLLGPEAVPQMVRAVVDTMAAIRSDGYAQAARMLSIGDIRADIATLPAALPVQVIYGDADVITPPARNLEIASLRPDMPVHVIAGAGHALYLEKPDAFNAAIAAQF